MNDAKKVTYCIFCYNQKDFLVDSFRSAFQQTYPNLEVIFSDDASSDGSYEVARTIVNSYQGAHTVIMRSSSKNRGIVDHINDVAEAASGEYLVITAADDVSAATRTAMCIEALEEQQGAAAFCDGWDFDGVLDWERFERATSTQKSPNSIVTRAEVFKVRGAISAGALWVFRRDCFQAFGRLPAALRSEDSVLPARAALLGKVIHVHQNLLARRAHPKSLSRSNEAHFSKDIVSRYYDQLAHLECLRDDLRKAAARGALADGEEGRMSFLVQRYVENELVRIPIWAHIDAPFSMMRILRDTGLLFALGDSRRVAYYLRKTLFGKS